jgi:hypothetical protein
MLNFASLIGLALFLWGIPSGILGIIQVFFILQRRADTSPAVIGKTVFVVIQALGRLLALPTSGFILFFQGWRLDPLLQFSVFLLSFGIICESVTGIASDYQKWRNRLGRASASIITNDQPSDTQR